MPVPALSASDLAFVQKTQRGVTKVLKPRLIAADQNLAAGLPVCTVAPAVTGTVAVGQLQTCTAGTWLNSPTMAYRWRRRGVGDIVGATGSTYTLVAADSGLQIECTVTASNGVGSVATNSNFISVP